MEGQKRSKRWRLWLAGGAFVALVLVLQVVLQWQLDAAVRERWIPALEQKLHTRVTVDRVRANVLRGTVALRGVRAQNPPGFGTSTAVEIRRVVLDAGLLPLLGGDVHIVAGSVRGVAVNVERSARGEWNVATLARGRESAAPEAGAPSVPAPDAASAPVAPAGTTAGPKPAKPRRVRVDKLTIEGTVRFADRTADAASPVDVVLAMEGSVDGFATASGREQAWATFELRGADAADSGRCTLELRGRLAPWTEAATAGFDATGVVGRVAGALLAPYLATNGVSCESLALTSALQCRDGRFDPARSSVVAYLTNAAWSASSSGLPGLSLAVPVLRVPMPVGGTLREPEVNFAYGLVKGISEAGKSMKKSVKASRLLQSLFGSGSRENKTDGTTPGSGSP